MYSIDINFLKDPERTPTGGGGGGGKPKAKPLPKSAMLPLFVGAAIGLIFPALMLGIWGFLKWQTQDVEQQIAEGQTELVQLQAKEQQIQQLRSEIEIARTQVNGLAGIFSKIKSWSAILQDIRDRVPDRVQIEAVKQADPSTVVVEAPPVPAEGETAPPPPPPPIGLTIAGIADTYQNVNDFLLTLKDSNLLNGEQTRLVRAELIDYPGTVQQTGNQQVNVELPKVVKYEIETQLVDLPDPELLKTLERKGAIGLATRLRTATEVGAAQEAAPTPDAAATPEVPQTGDEQQ